MTTRGATWAAALVVVAALAIAHASAREDAPVVDEPPHITAGYSYLVMRDARLNPEHPPLAKDVAALPLLLLGVDDGAFRSRPWSAEPLDQWDVSDQFLFRSTSDPDRIVAWARAPMLLFLAGTAALLFGWSRQLFGAWPAFLAVTLFVLSPTVLGHSRYVTTDVPAACGALASVAAFVAMLRRPTAGRTFLAGLALGFALLVKFSTLILLPVHVVLAASQPWLVGGSERRARAACRNVGRVALVSAYAVLGVVWPIYALHVSRYPPKRQVRDSRARLAEFPPSVATEAVVRAAGIPGVRALSHYALGAYLVSRRYKERVPSYFLGRTDEGGSALYFPVVQFAKEPLPLWGLVALALGILVATRGRRAPPAAGERRLELTAAIAFLGLYWSSCLQSTLTLGVRHLLPSYPFAALLLAAAFARARERLAPRAVRAVTVASAALLCAQAVEVAGTFPHYLAYFNPAVGGSRAGYRIAVDSNLDWGQDLRRLARWAREKGIEHLDLDYFGRSDPRRYLGRAYEPLGRHRAAGEYLSRHPEGGYVAVSATHLMRAEGGVERHPWLRAQDAIAAVGYSIFVWRIAPEQRAGGSDSVPPSS